MLLLKLVSDVIVFGQHQGRHKSPFRDGGPVYAAGRRDDNVGVFDDRVIEIVVDAGGEEVDELETVDCWWSAAPSSRPLSTNVLALQWCVLRLRRQTRQRHKNGRCLEEPYTQSISQCIYNSRS